jgi:tetratricopeptide (TPR) repeat protein
VITIQVTILGLITKAINKVEKDESPPAQPEMLPRPRGKKRLMILAAALLLIGASLGFGYLFLIKPGSEAPPPVARRSTSAKKKPPQPAAAESQQTKDAGSAEASPGEKESASEKASEKSVPVQEPAEQAGTTREQKEKTPEAEAPVPVTTAEVQTPETQGESETPESGMLPSLEPPVSSTPEKEKEIAPETSPSEGKEAASSDPALDETALSEEQQVPAEEDQPPYAPDLGNRMAGKPLTVSQEPESRAERYYNKGVSYQKQGEFVRAIEAYRKTLAYNPDHVQAHINLATAYLATGRLKEAEQELVYVHALRPKDCQILFNFGLLLFQIKEYVSAETKLKKLLQLDPFHLEANLLLSSVYEEKGQSYKAVEYCLRAHEINSVDSRVLYRLARAWDMTDQTTKAIEYYRLFLSTVSEKENQLRSVVRDRLDYLVSRKEEK